MLLRKVTSRHQLRASGGVVENPGMSRIPPGYHVIAYDATGLRGKHAKIVADPGVYYDLPEDRTEVVIADDEPNIYSELLVYLPDAPDEKSAIHYTCLAVKS